MARGEGRRSSPAEIAGARVDESYLLYGIDVAGSRAYVTDRNLGLIIIDITDLSSPAVLGSYDDGGRTNQLFVVGSGIYEADDSDGLEILRARNLPCP